MYLKISGHTGPYPKCLNGSTGLTSLTITMAVQEATERPVTMALL